MGRVLKNIARWFTRRFTGLLAFVLALIVVVAIGLQGFVFWLNTEQGGKWITAQLNTALEDTGYVLALDHFSLAGLFGLKAQRFELSHDQKSIVTGEKVSLSVNPASVGMKHLGASLKAEGLHVHDMPQSEDGAQDNGPLTIPDIYFKTAMLSVNIKDFSLSETIVEGGIHTHLRFKQNIDWRKNDIAIQGQIKLDDTQGSLADFLPSTVRNTLSVDLQAQNLHVKDLQLKHQMYEASLKGQYGLASEEIQADITGTFLDPQTLAMQLKDPVAVKARVEGQIADLSGDITLSTLYQAHRVEITSKLERKGAVISLSEIRGSGASIDVKGMVKYNIETSLADGELSAALPDLNIVQQFASGLDIKGSGNADIKLHAKNKVQAVSIDAVLSNLQYEDYTAQNIKAQIKVDDVKALESLSTDIQISKGRAASIDIEKATLKLTSKDARYHVTLLGNGHSYNPFSVDAAGYAQSLDPLDITLSKMRIKSGNGYINASGRIQKENLDVDLNGERLVLAQFPFVDLSSVPLTIDTLSGTITGDFVKPVFTANYNFHPTIEEQYDASFKAQSVFDTGILASTIVGKGRGIKKLNANLDLPLSFSLKPFAFELSDQAPIKGQLTAQADLQALANPFLDDGYTLKGDLNAETEISGTISALQLNGTAQLNNALFIDTYNDLQLNDISANARLNNRTLELTSLAAKDGERKGTMMLSGRFDFTDTAKPDIAASLVMDGMHLLKHENYNAWLNADIDLKTMASEYLISGTLSPQEVSIRIPDQFASPIPQLNIIDQEGQKKPTDTLFEKTKLDLKFKADNKIFVSGRGLDAELQGNLDVRGTLKTPLVEGNLETLRGRYEEFGRRFALDKAILRFQGTVPPSPYLDIEASTKVEDITGRVLITNSVEDPQIKLASTPSLPEDEVLSLILFGKDIQKISPFQAIQLANTLRKFSGKGGTSFDPLHQLQSATGLDDIRVESVGTEGTTIGAGKYISEKVYLEVEQGTAEGSGAASVEIKVTPSISVESKTTQSGESDIGVFWEWDY